MIVFLTVAYVLLLAILVKVGVIRLTLFWKLSPALWMILLLFVLFIPMQWGAPQGQLLTYRLSMEVNPQLNNSGEVTDILFETGQRVSKGDVLFKLDKTTYINKINSLKAQLKLATLRLQQATELNDANAGSLYDVESYQAQVDQLQANLENSEYNLKLTDVVAPQSGVISASSLRTGQKASFLMMRAELVIALDERRYVFWMPQYTLRNVKKEAEVEATFKLYPGKIFHGKVTSIGSLVGKGSFTYYTTTPNPPANFASSPIPVMVEFSDMPADLEAAIPGGASGLGVVYTDSMKPTQLIRRVMIRMTAWMNYVKAN